MRPIIKAIVAPSQGHPRGPRQSSQSVSTRNDPHRVMHARLRNHFPPSTSARFPPGSTQLLSWFVPRGRSLRFPWFLSSSHLQPSMSAKETDGLSPLQVRSAAMEKRVKEQADQDKRTFSTVIVGRRRVPAGAMGLYPRREKSIIALRSQ